MIPFCTLDSTDEAPAKKVELKELNTDKQPEVSLADEVKSLKARVALLETTAIGLEVDSRHSHPPNFHQLSVNFCLSPGTTTGMKTWCFLSSTLMVLAQLVALL